MKKLLQAMDGISTKPVEGVDSMKKFVSIIQEGANPHKVTLPVQMAMQHYQTEKNTKPIRKDRLIDKYFTEAETAITQRKEEKRAKINQYASVIAERVLMKESMAGVGLQPIDELSTELLGKYKKAAGADAKKADAEGNFERGNKRFKGINKATIKQFDNDAKKHKEQGIAEGSENNNITAQKIFFARSDKTPKGWSYDHVGFITQDGRQIQMSGHKGNDVYVTNDVTDDPEFPKQNIKIVSLSKPVSVPTTNSVGAENCGTFVANVLQANGIKGIDTQKIYSVFKQPQKQGVAEGLEQLLALRNKIDEAIEQLNKK